MTRLQQNRASNFAIGGIALLSLLFLITAAHAQTFKVLHTFTGPDGAGPVGGLTMDRAGNLYGVTITGGDDTNDCPQGGANPGCGTVFKLSRQGSGWVLNSLYVFRGYSDGIFPSGRVIFGPDGALYGVTEEGGQANCNAGFGSCGLVFRMTPPVTTCKSFICPWLKSNIFSFDGDDGDEPMSEVVFDRAGNLYGTTFGGGGLGDVTCFYNTNGCGTVYELSPSNGSWTETVLHAFPVSDSDGQSPYAPLILDSAGNLYGTTGQGGSSYGGTVFQMSPPGSGWTENLLYTFTGGSDGFVPEGGLLLASGKLIGTTTEGGAGGGGTAFDLTPGQGGWGFNLIYSLTGPQYYGSEAALTMDVSGNLYGTTVAGGAYGYGSAFKLTPSNGGWTYTSLHDFTGGSDGSYISGRLILDADGNLYGVADEGGYTGPCFRGCGIVFEITP